jgi:hypothetical protein
MTPFRPARDVTRAKLLSCAPPFIREYSRKSGRRWHGIKYQREIDAEFARRYGTAYISGQWIEFVENDERRYCQPDGILIELQRGRITVVEVKYSHTELAYYQLFDLYLPVLRALFPPQLWTFAAIEVCSRFDAAVALPVKPVMRKELLDAIPNAFNVHIIRAGEKEA